MTADRDALARRAWTVLVTFSLERDRKADAAAALDMSWTRILALRHLAAGPDTLSGLKVHLSADASFVTVIVDDLEKQGYVERMPHPRDRRAKLVELTPAGRKRAADAEAILMTPPKSLAQVPAVDLEAIVRVIGSIEPTPTRSVQRSGSAKNLSIKPSSV